MIAQKAAENPVAHGVSIRYLVCRCAQNLPSVVNKRLQKSSMYITKTGPAKGISKFADRKMMKRE